jgi:hypothetical protein
MPIHNRVTCGTDITDLPNRRHREAVQIGTMNDNNIAEARIMKEIDVNDFN